MASTKYLKVKAEALIIQLMFYIITGKNKMDTKMVKIEEKMIDKNEVAKQLMKSKVQAMFSHYSAGNLYYTVDVLDGKYQFPISTIDKGKLGDLYGDVYVEDEKTNKNVKFEKVLMKKIAEEKTEELDAELYGCLEVTKLSTDLGTTSFHAEMRGSELNRWIRKAIEKEEFVKVG